MTKTTKESTKATDMMKMWYDYEFTTVVGKDMREKKELKIIVDLEELQDDTMTYGKQHTVDILKRMCSEVIDIVAVADDKEKLNQINKVDTN